MPFEASRLCPHVRLRITVDDILPKLCKGRQECPLSPGVDDLNVTGNLQIQVGNADNGSTVVSRSNVSRNVQIQTGNGDTDSVAISGLSVGGNAQIQTGNGKADAVSTDALTVDGNLQIQTGNGAGDSVAVTAVSGPTAITGNTQIHLGNGADDTATVNGTNGAAFNGSFALQMGNGGNGGNTVNIGTVPGIVTFGGAVQVQFGNGTNTLNLAGTKGGAVPGSQVYFKKQAVFDGRNGKNTRYVGVNVFGARSSTSFDCSVWPRAQQTLRRRERRHRLPSPGGRRPSGPNARLETVRSIDHPLRRSRHESRHFDPRRSPLAEPPCPASRPSPTAADLELAGTPHTAGRRPADVYRHEPERLVGPGSLRNAIASADADSYSGSAFDTIDFALSPGLQTIDLTTIGDSTDDGDSALAITAPIRAGSSFVFSVSLRISLILVVSSSIKQS